MSSLGSVVSAGLVGYVPLLQTLAWVAVVVAGAIMLRCQLRDLLETVRVRVERGSSLRAGPIEVGEDLRGLPHIDAGTTAEPKSLTSAAKPPAGDLHAPDARAAQRKEAYSRCRDLFLTHVLSPSEKPGQSYDIFVYLIRHKSGDLSDVLSAEFFFGHYWGNEVFREENRNGLIGVQTSAYGPFLCTCLVTFRDGKEVILERYVDFEMGQRLIAQGAARRQRERRERRKP
jgi:hypothetical protein